MPLAEQTYAEDSRIYTPDNPNRSFVNIMEKLDVFVPSHFFGWWLKVSEGGAEVLSCGRFCHNYYTSMSITFMVLVTYCIAGILCFKFGDSVQVYIYILVGRGV